MTIQEKYKKEVIPAMSKRFSYKSPMAVPKIKKIILNSGFGKEAVVKTSSEREKYQSYIANSLGLISGQKASPCKAKKSIAAFKLREGMVVGVKVTLRGKRMYDFLEKLIYVIIPRIRDFRGLKESAISQSGEITIGFKEYIPFPELKMEKDKGLFGLEVIISTGAKSKEEGLELLKQIGLPFQKS